MRLWNAQLLCGVCCPNNHLFSILCFDCPRKAGPFFSMEISLKPAICLLCHHLDIFTKPGFGLQIQENEAILVPPNSDRGTKLHLFVLFNPIVLFITHISWNFSTKYFSFLFAGYLFLALSEGFQGALHFAYSIYIFKQCYIWYIVIRTGEVLSFK